MDSLKIYINKLLITNFIEKNIHGKDSSSYGVNVKWRNKRIAPLKRH